MQYLKLQQSKFEIETSKLLLNFFTDENVLLKNRLAEVVKDNFEKNILGVMENYLNRFVAQDDLINLLKNDISNIENRLCEKINDDGAIVKDIYPGLQLLHSNILKTEGTRMQLRKDFNNFLSEKFEMTM